MEIALLVLAIAAVIARGYFDYLGRAIDNKLADEHKADRSNNVRGIINIPAKYNLPDDFPDKKLLAQSRVYDKMQGSRYWVAFLIAVAVLLGVIVNSLDWLW